MELDRVRQAWYEIVKGKALVCREGEWNILIGDGVKQSKEARHMPGGKKLFQESEDSSKAAYIFEHIFGSLGIVIGNQAKKFCLPLSIRLHNGCNFLKLGRAAVSKRMLCRWWKAPMMLPEPSAARFCYLTDIFSQPQRWRVWRS